MCGIIGAFKINNFNPVERVLRQFEKQKSRGQRGFGFVAEDNNEVIYCKSEGFEDIKIALKELKNPNFVLFHHRIPTSSGNNIIANHPIFIHNKKNLNSKYMLIHNGHITNSDELKEKHEKLGIHYRTESKKEKVLWNQYQYTESYTDSESAGIDLALFIEHGWEFTAKGGMAILMLELDKNNKPISVYSYRNIQPIKFYRNQNGVFYSSEGPGYELPPDTLTRFDLKTFQLEKIYIAPSRTADIQTCDSLCDSPGEYDYSHPMGFSYPLPKVNAQSEEEIERKIRKLQEEEGLLIAEMHGAGITRLRESYLKGEINKVREQLDRLYEK
jgi:predicted glutamine amidotransferase